MINMRKITNRTLGFSACRSVASVLLVALFIVVSACGTINDELPSYAETSSVNVGDMAPEFSATTLDGELVRVGGESSVPTLLILFSHTCPDCKNLLTALQREIDGGKVEHRIIAVSRGGSEAEIGEYRHENRFTFPLVADGQAEVYYKYATMYVPRCYVIDCDGVVRFVTFEYREGDVDELMEQMTKY